MPCCGWLSRPLRRGLWLLAAFAATMLQGAAGTVPQVDALLQAAARARQAGEMVTAAALYKRVLERHPGHRLAAYNAGVILENANRPQLAAGVWREALAADAGDLFAYEHLVRNLALSGGLDGELARTAALVAEYPQAPVPRLQQALALTAAGRQPEAVAHLEAMLMEQPASNIAYNFLKDTFASRDLFLAYVADVGERARRPDAGEPLRLLHVRLLLERGHARDAMALAARTPWQQPASTQLLSQAGVLDAAAAAAAVAGVTVQSAAEQTAGGSDDAGPAESAATAEDAAPQPSVVTQELPELPELPERPNPEEEAALPDFGPADPRSASRYEQEGRLALAGRDDQAAMAALQRSVEAAPMRLQPRITLALLLQQNGLPAAARSALRGPVEPSPWDIYQQGWRAVRDDFIDADYAGVDIFSLRHQARQSVHTVADARSALQRLLTALADPYALLFEAERFAGYLLSPNARGLTPTVRSPWVPVPEQPLETPPAPVSPSPARLPGTQAPIRPATPQALPSAPRATHRLQVKPQALQGDSGQEPTATERPESVGDWPRDPAVHGHRLPGEVGHLVVPSLAALDVPQQVEMALAEMAGMRDLVVDLRGNRGGDGEVAVEVASLFLDPGAEVCTYQTRRGQEVRRSRGGSVLRPPGSLVVLMDGRTASAAELLAAALHESAGALLVGERTAGKGVGQRALLLPDGSGMSLTRFRLRSPSGVDWNGRGLSPGLAVAAGRHDDDAGERPDTALLAAATWLRAQQR